MRNGCALPFNVAYSVQFKRPLYFFHPLHFVPWDELRSILVVPRSSSGVTGKNNRERELFGINMETLEMELFGINLDRTCQ